MTITVTAKSNKGKNRIKEHGNQWEVIEGPIAAAFCDQRQAVLLKSNTTGYTRWMELENDRDFQTTDTL